jgi:hypothetical protein
MTCPATADPTATPTEIADVSQAIPSVRRRAGACCSIRLNPAMKVGEMARPEQEMTAASTASPGNAQNVAVPAGDRAHVTMSLASAMTVYQAHPLFFRTW